MKLLKIRLKLAYQWLQLKYIEYQMFRDNLYDQVWDAKIKMLQKH